MSTEADELDAALAALYRRPLGEFVAARDQLARQLRTAGDRQAARQVAGLRRPSISAWAANQLAHAAPHGMAELLEAGTALQQAQQAALAGQHYSARQLRTAHAHLRAAITRLTQRAATLLQRAGHAASDATLTRLAATLQAAATGDAATRAALAAGRLAGDLDPARSAVALAVTASEQETASMRRRRTRPAPVPRSAFAGFRFPSDVVVLAVRWYLRFTLSYRDVEELLAERGIEVDHVTVYRWVQRFIPILADAARPCRHAVGDRWQVDETYVKVAGQWRYVYRAVDQFGQVIDVFVSVRRDAKAAHQFFQRAIAATKVTPVEITTDQAPVYPVVLEEQLPAAWHRTDRYANNRVECEHGRLKARLGPMRGLKQDRSARVIIAGHALGQNVRRGHYELAVEEPVGRRVAVAFDELALAV